MRGVSGAGCNSVQALATALFALHFLGVTLDCSSSLALALGSGLLVKLAAADFSQYTGFFAGALETTQGYVEGFVLFNFDGGHPGRTFINTGGGTLSRQSALGVRRFSRVADSNVSCRRMQSPSVEKHWSALGAAIIMRAFEFA